MPTIRIFMGILMTYSNCVNNNTVMQLREYYLFEKLILKQNKKVQKTILEHFLGGDWLNKYDLLKQYCKVIFISLEMFMILKC